MTVQRNSPLRLCGRRLSGLRCAVLALPLALLALRQLGILNSSTLIRQWRYAVVIIAVIAAAMPGADPVTTGLETLPLILLYLASIVLLKIADRRAAARAAAEFTEPAESNLGS